jgi:Chromo (CHRromatin Organisation MOdifier) domain
MTTPHQSEEGVGVEAREIEDVMGSAEQGEHSTENNEEGAVFFEVERILAEERSKENGQLYYKIRWLGYTSDYDSLEPAHEIEHCVEIVAAWEAEKARNGTEC